MTILYSTLEGLLTITKDLVAICVPIAALCIAAKGLSTWRRQLYGQNSFEVAKKLGFALKQFREEFHYFRRIMVHGGETEAAYKRFGLDDKKTVVRDEARLATILWKHEKLTEKWNTVAHAAFEAELVLGPKVMVPIIELHSVLGKVDSAILFLQMTNGRGIEDSDEYESAIRRVYGHVNDDLGRQFEGCFQDCFEPLKVHLNHQENKLGFSWPNRRRDHL
jgi:hypothetical protein